MTYEARMDGASQAIEADNLAEAIDAAREWIKDGSWDTSEGTVWAHGYLAEIDEDEDGEPFDHAEHRITVTIPPQEPSCIDGEEHDWQSPYEIVGGIKDNPGVWGHGGGIIMREACMRCGCGKTSDSWAQDPATGQEGLSSVSYEEGKYARQIAEVADNE